MEITEVRVKLVEGKQDKLKAFCSITIEDSFVIRDLKIIEGTKGLFVAMPSRRLTVRCSKCGSKSPVRANFCSECGYAMPQDRAARAKNGRLKLHADIAHPINSSCREDIQNRVLETYAEELTASEEPGYMPMSFDDFNEPEDDFQEFDPEPRTPATAARREPWSDRERGRGERPGRGGPEGSRGDRPRGERGRSESRRSENHRGDSPRRERAERSEDAGRRERPERFERPERSERPRHSDRADRPSRGRDGFAAQEPASPPARPPRPPIDFDDEPDDNFGAGLF